MKIEKFLVGNSDFRLVNRRRLDKTGATHIRTLHESTVRDLTDALSTCHPRNSVKCVVVHIGPSDTTGSIESTVRDYDVLVSQILRVFPRAEVALTATIPRKKKLISKTISLNKHLSEICKKRKITLLQEPYLSATDGSIDSRLFLNDGRVNERGTALLLRQISKFLRRIPPLPGSTLASQRTNRQIAPPNQTTNTYDLNFPPLPQRQMMKQQRSNPVHKEQLHAANNRVFDNDVRPSSSVTVDAIHKNDVTRLPSYDSQVERQSHPDRVLPATDAHQGMMSTPANIMPPTARMAHEWAPRSSMIPPYHPFHPFYPFLNPFMQWQYPYPNTASVQKCRKKSSVDILQ